MGIVENFYRQKKKLSYFIGFILHYSLQLMKIVIAVRLIRKTNLNERKKIIKSEFKVEIPSFHFVWPKLCICKLDPLYSLISGIVPKFSGPNK